MPWAPTASQAQHTWPGSVSSETAVKHLLEFVYHSLTWICTGKMLWKVTVDVTACPSLGSRVSEIKTKLTSICVVLCVVTV